MRKLSAAVIFASLLLCACGGSGSTVTTGTGGGSSGGSGGGGGSGGATPFNVVNGIVDQGPAALAAADQAAVDVFFVKVTVCAPGSTTTCQTIDHVQVDTGSQGLRILASVLNSTMLSALQPITINGGASLAECTQFVDGYSWGPLVTADLHIGGADTATSGESAPGIPMQVIGTTSYAVPVACSGVAGTAENTVTAFGANGIIGLGLFDEDCGTGCRDTAANGLYFSCTNGAGCVETAVPLASQMQNPVNMLAAVNGVTDNNGVVIVLPAVGASGAATVAGTLVFGIGTQSNNALSPSATVLATDSFFGFVSTTFISQTFPDSYLDSGSNAFYFNDSNITTCTQSFAVGFFCPPNNENFSATINGTNGQAAGVNFTVGDAATLFNANQNFAAFSNLAGGAGTTGSGTQTFAWGLPFYFGRTVYTAMEHQIAGGTPGPYFAF